MHDIIFNPLWQWFGVICLITVLIMCFNGLYERVTVINKPVEDKTLYSYKCLK